MTPKQQHLNVSQNLRTLLGGDPFTDRESEIASNAYDAGLREGRMQQGVQDSEIAQKLLKELSAIHLLIDWPEGDPAQERIGKLLAQARGEL